VNIPWRQRNNFYDKGDRLKSRSEECCVSLTNANMVYFWLAARVAKIRVNCGRRNAGCNFLLPSLSPRCGSKKSPNHWLPENLPDREIFIFSWRRVSSSGDLFTGLATYTAKLAQVKINALSGEKGRRCFCLIASSQKVRIAHAEIYPQLLLFLAGIYIWDLRDGITAVGKMGV